MDRFDLFPTLFSILFSPPPPSLPILLLLLLPPFAYTPHSFPSLLLLYTSFSSHAVSTFLFVSLSLLFSFIIFAFLLSAVYCTFLSFFLLFFLLTYPTLSLSPFTFTFPSRVPPSSMTFSHFYLMSLIQVLPVTFHVSFTLYLLIFFPCLSFIVLFHAFSLSYHPLPLPLGRQPLCRSPYRL